MWDSQAQMTIITMTPIAGAAIHAMFGWCGGELGGEGEPWPLALLMLLVGVGRLQSWYRVL